MNNENSKKIWKYIQQAGDKLVRNPYAHVAICVKNKFGQSYKEIPDERMVEVLQFIDNLVENPS